jgi:cytochrome c oxidase subunit II
MANESTHASAGVGRPLAVVMWLIPIAAIATGARGWLPALASEHGAGIDRMLHYLMICTGGLLLIGHTALGYILWRFSGEKRVSFRMATPKQERTWSLIPIVMMSLIAEGGVLVIGLPVWDKFYGASPADAVSVEITAEQFAWNIRYPGKDGVFGRTSPTLLSLDNPLGIDKDDPASHDDIPVIGLMYLPVNRPVRIRLRSKDVLHSFFLPFQRVKQDVVPGMAIQVWFVPNQLGDYEIACAELCGMGHYQMRGLMRVVSEEEFTKQLAELPTFQQ